MTQCVYDTICIVTKHEIATYRDIADILGINKVTRFNYSTHRLFVNFGETDPVDVAAQSLIVLANHFETFVQDVATDVGKAYLNATRPVSIIDDAVFVAIMSYAPPKMDLSRIKEKGTAPAYHLNR